MQAAVSARHRLRIQQSKRLPECAALHSGACEHRGEVLFTGDERHSTPCAAGLHRLVNGSASWVCEQCSCDRQVVAGAVAHVRSHWTCSDRVATIRALPPSFPVSDRISCVHCGNIGFVRAEHVIVGERSVTQFYCGRCEHTWTVAEEGQERRSKPRPASATANEKLARRNRRR